MSKGGIDLTNIHYPGETIGLIGSSISSALLAQAAGRLGYRVASLVLEEENAVRQFASWQTVAKTYNDQALTYFAQRVDWVMVEVGLLANRSFQLLNELTEVALSQDLVAITTDRLIEKAYLDSHKCLVTPYSLVTNLTDIKEAVEYIGFPCVLKASQRNVSQAHNHLILYSEDDYPQAEAKLQIGTGILEAWIPVERKVSLTVVRNLQGDTLLYPVFEVLESGERKTKQVRYPARIPDFVDMEIKRLGLELAQSLDVTGSITLKLFVTSTNVIYVNAASIGLGDEAVFTIGSTSLDHFEASLRASAGLALPDLKVKAPAAIALPMEQLNFEAVMNQYRMRTDWGFALFNPMGRDPKDIEGQVIVTGDSIQSCERQLEITDLY